MLCPQSWQWTIRFPSAPGTESYRSWATLCHDFLCIYLSLLGNVLPVGQWLIHLCAQHLTQCLSAYLGASQPALWQRIRLPMQEIQETQVGLLGQEDPLEEEMAVHSSILAWRTPWTEEPGGLQSMGPQTVGHDWARKRTRVHTHTHTHTHTHVPIYWTNIWMNHSKPITIANLLSSGCTAYRFE